MALKDKSDFTDSEIKGFINFAFHDYLGARTLLLAKLPTQGTILGITSLEKLLKAYSLLSGDKIKVGRGGHTIFTMAKTIQSKNPVLIDIEDLAFIEHINKGYFLRYPDNLTSNFELYFPAKRILENLDRVFCRIIEENTIDSYNKNFKSYDIYKRSSNLMLLKKNVHFNISLKNVLSDETQHFSYYKFDGNIFTERFSTTNLCKHDKDWNEPL